MIGSWLINYDFLSIFILSYKNKLKNLALIGLTLRGYGDYYSYNGFVKMFFKQ